MIEVVKNEVFKNLQSKTQEFKRLFHGRGGYFQGFEFLTIDSIDCVLFVIYFSKIEKHLDEALQHFFKELYNKQHFSCVVLQRRYNKNGCNEVLKGELTQPMRAKEGDLQYHLNLLSNQNIGFFGDMKNGRALIQNIAKDKKVLNLFSYTCSLGVAASYGGACRVVNVDMSKTALSIGRANYHLNQLKTNSVEFMPYNILKSWNRIKKPAPYDVIIIDPPSFQKGSFIASRDYVKIITKLKDLSSNDCTVLACLNDPFLDANGIIQWFEQHASAFRFVKILDNVNEFKSVEEKKSLKCVVFTNSLQL
jgi:23S rRNA (cytosine1962-C5)-methyltransferase